MQHENEENEVITFEHDPDANVHRTSLKIRDLKATYDQLVGLFGEPKKVNGDHSRVEWVITFSDGGILTVYDWNDDPRIYDVTEWNVGGHDFMTAYRIHDILNGRPIEF